MASTNPALARLANAKMTADHIKLTYGRYLFEVQAHRGKFGGFYGDTAIAELKCLTGEDLPSYPVGQNGEQVKRTGSVHKPGQIVSYSESMSAPGKKGDATTGRFAKHLTRVAAVDQPFNVPQLQMILGTPDQPAVDQPFAFFRVEVEVVPNYIPPNPPKYPLGTFLPQYRWTTVDMTEEQLAQIEAKRAEAKLPPLKATLEKLFSLG